MNQGGAECPRNRGAKMIWSLELVVRSLPHSEPYPCEIEADEAREMDRALDAAECGILLLALVLCHSLNMASTPDLPHVRQGH